MTEGFLDGAIEMERTYQPSLVYEGGLCVHQLKIILNYLDTLERVVYSHQYSLDLI